MPAARPPSCRPGQALSLQGWGQLATEAVGRGVANPAGEEQRALRTRPGAPASGSLTSGMLQAASCPRGCHWMRAQAPAVIAWEVLPPALLAKVGFGVHLHN